MGTLDHASHSPSPGHSPLPFRPKAKTYALQPLERTLAGVIITLLIFLPWALGGLRVWGQWPMFGLSVLAFLIALIPRTYDDRYHTGGNLRLYMWPKLLRFPIFWLGLLYIALVICQICNPAWRFRSSNNSWWLESMDYVTWLPHGIEGTPFTMMNGWRALMIHGSAWLVVCALWVGITRRKTAQLILTTLAINGVVLAFIVILQRLTGTQKLLWLFDSPTTYFAASFTYKNHAGEFFALILALCLGLAWWHTRQTERKMGKSNPGMVWGFAALLTVVGQMFTFARAASAVGLVFLVMVAVAFGLRLLFRRSGGPSPLITAVTTLLGAAFMTIAITQMDSDKVWKRFERLFKEDQAGSVTSRQLATQSTLDMARENIVLGHGVGGFRFLFPLYQQHYPEIWTRIGPIGPKKWGQQRMYWEHSHNDYVEFLAELGLVGIGLAVVALLTVLIAAWQVNLFGQFGLLLMLGGPALVAATAAVDFPMHNPAVLFTSLAVIALTLRWAQLARRG